MPDPEFWQTAMGYQFIEGTMPKLANAVERLAKAIEGQEPTTKEDPGTTKVVWYCERCRSMGVAVHSGTEDYGIIQLVRDQHHQADPECHSDCRVISEKAFTSSQVLMNGLVIK